MDYWDFCYAGGDGWIVYYKSLWGAVMEVRREWVGKAWSTPRVEEVWRAA
jgi:hypothetical protein